MSYEGQVRVKDQAGSVQAVLTDWRALSYTLAVNAPGQHTLTLRGPDPYPGAMSFPLDAQIEVWRRDAEHGIPWQLDYAGFHRTHVHQTTANGDSLYTSYGSGYADLLKRRCILYTAGAAGADKSGVGETVLKAYVTDNAGPDATLANGRTSDGVTAGLSVQASGGAGLSWSGARSWRNLLDVCQEIALATGVDFGVVGTGPATFEFQAHAYPWGADRSVTGLDPLTGLNAAGHAPVVFSLGFGNMTIPTHAEARTAELNAVTALGQGLGAGRATEERTDAAAILESPWNRREATQQANTQTDTAGLQAVADAFLAQNQASNSLTFQVLQTAASRYGRNYFLGDIVTARYEIVEVNLQIVSVDITVQNGLEQINIGLRTVPVLVGL